MHDDNRSEKKQIIYDLSRYKNKTVFLKLVGGKELAGRLVSFDSLQNVVLSDPKQAEYAWKYGKYVICLGGAIISIALGLPHPV